MNWKVKFRKELYSELSNYLFLYSPKENGCFLLGNNSGNILFITEIIYPENEDWLLKEKDLCTPKANYISSACLKADISKKTLLFVHSHPQDFHPSTFSDLDIESNDRLFKNLSTIISMPMASLVFSRKGIHGVVYYQNKYHEIESYSILSKTNDVKFDINYQASINSLNKFDRQLRFIDESNFNILSNLKIAIIGLGGIGSALAVQLANMGVKTIGFYDFDKIELHNVPRISYANEQDIGKYKVDVAKSYIESISECEIEVFKINIVKETPSFENYNFIFGCLDNHTARAKLNESSVTLGIPYIDSACAIPLDNENRIVQAVTSVTTVMPLEPCLWCCNVLNGVKIMEESLSEEELKQRREDGYTLSIDEAPSIITLTTAVATIAANRLLNLIGILSELYPIKVVHDFNKTLLLEPPVSLNEKCTCRKKSPFLK